MRYNPNFETNATFNTDRAKKVVFKLNYIGRHFLGQETSYNELHPSMIFRLGNHVLLTGQLNYAWNSDDLQYVNTVASSGSGADHTAYLTPDFSIQYYGSPFTSVAKYDKFKLAADTRSSNYPERFSEFKNNEISYNAGSYTVDRGSNTMTGPIKTMYIIRAGEAI